MITCTKGNKMLSVLFSHRLSFVLASKVLSLDFRPIFSPQNEAENEIIEIPSLLQEITESVTQENNYKFRFKKNERLS